MTALPLVSIIIPVYNTEAYLKRCLNSVTAQTYTNIEIITVDDGSSDKSGAILEKFSSRDKRIKVIYQENRGQGAARNKALDIANGEWIAFIDSDDSCSYDMIKTLLKKALNTGSDVCWAGFIFSNRNYGTSYPVHPSAGIYSGKTLLDWYFRKEKNPPYGLCCGIYKRKIFDKLRFPEGRIFEDAYLLPRIIGNIKKCVCTEIPVYHYCLRKSGTFCGSDIKKQMDILWVMQENIKYVSEHFPDYTGHIYRRYFEECCNLLSKMGPSGRRYPEYWQPLLAAFKDAAENMTDYNIYRKGDIFLFNISPALLAQFYRVKLSGGQYLLSFLNKVSEKRRKT